MTMLENFRVAKVILTKSLLEVNFQLFLLRQINIPLVIEKTNR